MIGQNDGIENEKQITSAFNNKFKNLSECQKKFIAQLNPQVCEESIIKAKKIGGMGYKPDVQIETGNFKWNISVKKGVGNSVHQEKTDYFIHYCMHFLDMTQKEKISLLLFLYGDGTIDGDSLAEERLSDEELISAYKDDIQRVQKFLDRNKRNLIERFLVYGRSGKQNNIKADYLYHGDTENGVWCPLNDNAIDYLVSLPNSTEAPLSIGPLTLQVWNRNMEAKPNLEDRRHSIQVKWGACKTYILEINKLCNKKRQEVSTSRQRTIGDNSQGFENQDNLLLMLDCQKVGNLNTAIKALIKEMYPLAADNDVIRATKVTGDGFKPRVSININNEIKNISIFMGTGNAVHQEHIQTFLPYCKDSLGMTDKEENAFLKILYGDGTIDGSTVADLRLNDAQIKESYGDEIRIVQTFLDRNRKELIQRFLIYGKNGKENNMKSDFIYYGTEATGRCNPYPQVVEYILNQENSKDAVLAIGSLTLQTWNRNLSAKPEFEYKRKSIQVKWGSMKKHLNAIRNMLDTNRHGTVDGDWEEYELVGSLNRNKNPNSRLWKTISERLELSNLQNVYAVTVSNTVFSKLADRNVLPKADVYLVRGKIAHEVLMDNNYWLSEDVIQNLNVEKIKNSGISCKRPDSKSFTYAKLSINSFVHLFREPNLGAGISIFVQAGEVYLNKSIVEAWGSSEKVLIEKYKYLIDELNLEESQISLDNIEICKIIKSNSIIETEQIIKNNPDISNAIFKGKGVFEEPYAASFIYSIGEAEAAYIPKFSITTGAGRHKGIYTIVIKP